MAESGFLLRVSGNNVERVQELSDKLQQLVILAFKDLLIEGEQDIEMDTQTLDIP